MRTYKLYDFLSVLLQKKRRCFLCNLSLVYMNSRNIICQITINCYDWSVNLKISLLLQWMSSHNHAIHSSTIQHLKVSFFYIFTPSCSTNQCLIPSGIQFFLCVFNKRTEKGMCDIWNNNSYNSWFLHLQITAKLAWNII